MKAGLSFDRAAADYEAVRPGYPRKMYEDILSITSIPTAGKILDIGSGTGQSALPLIEKNYQMTCLEPGRELYKILLRKTRPYPNSRCINSTFEDLSLRENFDIILAATSFHWLNLPVSLPKIGMLLKPSGYLCLGWNTHSQPYNGFFQEVQEIYRRNFPPQTGSDWKGLVAKRNDVLKAVKKIGLFKEIYQQYYDWQITFSAADYIRLLNTFSDNIMLSEQKRNKFFKEIRELLEDNYESKVERPYRTELSIFQLSV